MTDREERERAIQEADRLLADCDRDEWRRAQREQTKKRSGDDLGLVYKTTYTPTAQPVQQVTVWDAATEARWNAWLDDRVNQHLDAFEKALDKALVEILENQIARREEKLGELRKELQTEIAGLRADMTIDKAMRNDPALFFPRRPKVVTRSESVPTKRRSNVA